ncbi:MAG: hypothetical protein WEC59_07960 [Salibacteraceae bacterium]
MRIKFTFLLLFIIGVSFAQSSQDHSVLLQAEALESPSRIVLTWNEDPNATSYTIARKLEGTSAWQTLQTGITTTSYQDDSVATDVVYDYRVIKTAGYTGYGYARAGIRLSVAINKGGVLVLVDSVLSTSISAELDVLKTDLENDGYHVVMHESSDTSVMDVKQVILDADAAMQDLTMLYIIGHVPVPYSGEIAPDGHVPDHLGAWPADVFYADLDGNWTDNVINNTGASDPRNQNAPGDGKFDQSLLPGNGVELMIGRIDFSNLTHFSEDEAELTKRYLNRVHAYKKAQWNLPKRALIDDNFGGFGGEAFGSNGWRNFAPLIGRDSISAGDYRTGLSASGYLFSYGCGGGTHESAGGIGTSTQLSGDSLQTGFTMLFGSYFGDWDRQNNFMRSALAQGTTMSISWAGRPWWYFHPMGIGQSIGSCTKLTQNNSNEYFASYGGRFVHVALLGDPSLRMEYTAPPVNLAADTVDTFHVQLSWTASSDTSIDGYNIYRQPQEGEWIKLNESPITNTQFTDSCLLDSGQYTYAVKAAALRSGFSGSYWNESLGVSTQLDIYRDKNPELLSSSIIQINIDGNTLFLLEAEGNYISFYTWRLAFDTIHGDGWDSVYFIPNIGLNNYELEYGNSCAFKVKEGEFMYTVGMGEEHVTPDLRLYPNPLDRNDRVLHLSTDERLNDSDFIIMTLDGRIADRGIIKNNTARLTRNLSAGAYIIKIGEMLRSTFVVK